jgi:hypothetical protein
MSETIETGRDARTGPDGQGETPEDPRTDETPKERVDRELIELLNELRVVLPGIQVLFAFLLTVPFSQRFTTVNGTEKAAFFIAVMCTAASTAALMTVPNYHRLTFRQATKERLLRIGNVLTLIGTALLGIAIVAVLFLITDYLYDGIGVGIVTVTAAVVIAWLWFLMPVTSRSRHHAQDVAKGPEHLT